MGHTPGPWEVDDFGAVTGKGGAHIASVSDLDDFPCADADSMHPEEREQVEAEYATNRRLIAAAPDLLEAMKQHLKDSRCDGDLCNFTWHEEFRKLIRIVEPDWVS